MNRAMQTQEASALLEWYLAAGVDMCILNEPVNRFAAEKPTSKQNVSAPPVKTSPLPGAVSPALAAAPPAAIARARELADAATTLEQLKAAVMEFDGCALKKTAMHTVFADGNPQAKVMLIGEAPGAEEDRQGIPFCGPSGKLLDTMFTTIGLPRDRLYISNSIFWRPPGNRTPTPEEIAICRPFVEKHIALINPSVLVLLGACATRALLEVETGITRLRGKPHTYSNRYMEAQVTAFAMFHPSFLLRQSAQKRLAWHDLLMIESFLKSLKPL